LKIGKTLKMGHPNPADNLLKVGGRLEHADLPEGTKHPIILAPDHL
jgi:hypothetical protein